MNDLQAQLQAALGDAYRLERELGGGGMSRVFVATETALNRKVVIKFLSPELAAGVSADRFRREIQLAARLHHPHIVPLLAAGEVKLDGDQTLLYYTMPLVDGESLRAPGARWQAPARRGAPHLPRGHRRTGLRTWPGRGAPRHQAGQHPAFGGTCGSG